MLPQGECGALRRQRITRLPSECPQVGPISAAEAFPERRGVFHLTRRRSVILARAAVRPLAQTVTLAGYVIEHRG
jgi:hypothetical protein